MNMVFDYIRYNVDILYFMFYYLSIDEWFEIIILLFEMRPGRYQVYTANLTGPVV